MELYQDSNGIREKWIQNPNIGSNIETYNGQKIDNGLLGLSFGNYISKKKQLTRVSQVKKQFKNS